MPKKLSPETRSEITKMAQEGISRSEIARTTGVSPASVTRALGASRAYRGKRASAETFSTEEKNGGLDE